jgi:hypothetical protein
MKSNWQGSGPFSELENQFDIYMLDSMLLMDTNLIDNAIRPIVIAK